MADFDHTLTRRQFPEGKQGDSTFKVIHTWNGTPEPIQKLCQELYLHYYPQESDPLIPEAEKKLILKEWFEKDFDAMASCGYTPKCFTEMVRDSRILFRSGVTDLLNFS